MQILVVEDNDINRDIIEEALGDEYALINAKSGEEALSILRKRQDEIELVLLDIILPGIDGFEVLRQMKDMNMMDDIPVVVISSENPENYEENAFLLGASDYIIRPYDMSFLKRRVRNNISLHGFQKAQISNLNHAADFLSHSLQNKKTDASAIIDSLHNLTYIYDVVRLVEPSKMVEYRVTPDGHVQKGSSHCFEVWDKHSRCENCISAKAYNDKGKHSKYEFIGDDIFLATAKYVEINQVPFILEMVSKADDTVFLDAMGKESLIESVLAQNRKLYLDALTGAYNRHYLEEQLKGLKISSVAILDLDRFKDVNDTYGHLAGDEALKTVASLIKCRIRGTDALIRYGGDEFVLVFEGMNKETLSERLEHIRMAVEGYRFDQYKDMKITLSIGAVMAESCDEAAISSADRKLYEAKKTRNKVVI